MNGLGRSPSSLLGALGLAMLVAPCAGTAQEIDNRPIYYMMLKSIESEFQHHSAALAADLEQRTLRIRENYESRNREIVDELAMLEAQRKDRESVFVSERDALNARIDALNERIALRDGRLNEEKRLQQRYKSHNEKDPQVESLMRRIAERLAEIESIRATYRSRLEATRSARAALSAQFEQYMSAGDPLALEIRSLEEDWRLFAEVERQKLAKMTDAYAREYAAYTEWLNHERNTLEQAGETLASMVNADREKRTLHAGIEAELRERIDAYNALLEIHNKAAPGDPEGDERRAKLTALDARIVELQTALADTRKSIIEATGAFETQNQEYEASYEQFSAEKREREAMLAAKLAEIDRSRVVIETDIDAQRHEIDKQIRALEAQISDDFGDARRKLETLNARLIDEFGREHEGLDVAITKVLEQNDDGQLYRATGAPRFDLSRPLTAAVYAAIEQVVSDRNRIDARIVALGAADAQATQAEIASQPRAEGGLEQNRAALSTERQQLLEAHSSFAREQQSLIADLEKRQRSNDKDFADARTMLSRLYSARASLARAELQAVQQVLVAAATGVPGATSASSDYERSLGELREIAARTDAETEASMRAAHALVDRIKAKAVGSATSSIEWKPFASRRVTRSRELVGSDKAASASAWLSRFRLQPRFAAIAEELAASGAVANGAEALSNLFMVGVMEHATMIEQQLEDGGTGIQVNILDRAYQLDVNGSLQTLPSG